jgi:CheY-like chemotaxis protein
LALVKSLAEMHGGNVEAHSEGPGRGSEFVVRLPVAAGTAPAEAAPIRRPEAMPGPAGGRRVLVVDDNEDVRSTLAGMLARMGNDVWTAQDGLQAVAAAARFRPEQVLLDLRMPNLNGYDAAQRIREQPGGRDVILVAHTGWGQEQDRQRVREAGFDHHLTKPVDPAVLEELLAHLSHRAS